MGIGTNPTRTIPRTAADRDSNQSPRHPTCRVRPPAAGMSTDALDQPKEAGETCNARTLPGRRGYPSYPNRPAQSYRSYSWTFSGRTTCMNDTTQLQKRIHVEAPFCSLRAYVWSRCAMSNFCCARRRELSSNVSRPISTPRRLLLLPTDGLRYSSQLLPDHSRPTREPCCSSPA